VHIEVPSEWSKHSKVCMYKIVSIFLVSTPDTHVSQQPCNIKVRRAIFGVSECVCVFVDVCVVRVKIHSTQTYLQMCVSTVTPA